MKKKILFLCLYLFSIIITAPLLEAAPPDVYYKQLNGNCKNYKDIEIWKKGYCVQLHADYRSNATYTNCDASLSCYEAASAYYGYKEKDTIAWWQAQAILNGRTFYKDNDCERPIEKGNVEADAIKYCTVPKFANNVFNLKSDANEIEFEDENEVLGKDYKLYYTSDAFTAKISGNSIIVKPLKAVKDAEILIYKGDYNAVKGLCSTKSQNLVKVEKAPYVSTKVKVNIEEEQVIVEPEKTVTVRIHKVEPNTDYSTSSQSSEYKHIENNQITFKVGNGQTWANYQTNSNGISIIADQNYGTTLYYQETEAPEGYYANSAMKSIYLDEKIATEENGKEYIDIYVYNYPIRKCSLRIKKVDQDGNGIHGAFFKVGTNEILTGTNGTDYKIYSTDENGDIALSNVPCDSCLMDGVKESEDNCVHRYYAREITPREAFTEMIGEERTNTLNDEQLYFPYISTNSIYNDENDEIEMPTYTFVFNDEQIYDEITVKNIKITDLTIIKKDKDSNKVLSGAKFELYDGDGKLFKEFTTDENGKYIVEDIPYGVYTLKEVSAPKGYANANDMTIYVTSDDQEITVENQLKNAKTGLINTVIPFAGVSALGVGAYLLLKRRQKFI